MGINLKTFQYINMYYVKSNKYCIPLHLKATER